MSARTDGGQTDKGPDPTQRSTKKAQRTDCHGNEEVRDLCDDAGEALEDRVLEGALHRILAERREGCVIHVVSAGAMRCDNIGPHTVLGDALLLWPACEGRGESVHPPTPNLVAVISHPPMLPHQPMYFVPSGLCRWTSSLSFQCSASFAVAVVAVVVSHSH